VTWNVTANKYTCPALVNAVTNFGIPLNAENISCTTDDPSAFVRGSCSLFG